MLVRSSQKKSNYEVLKQLIAEDKLFLLPHKKYNWIRKHIVYARCGRNEDYFRKAYSEGDVVLQFEFGGFGRRVGHPIPWEEALTDFLESMGRAWLGEAGVVIGNIDEGLTELLSGFIEEATLECDVKITSIHHAEELLQFAQNSHVDVFVLVLNNLIFPPGKMPAEIRIEKALKLVAHLKETYGKPVIALAGWPDDPSLGEKVKLAGASFFFRLPFEAEDFEEAIEKCLGEVVLPYLSYDRRDYRKEGIKAQLVVLVGYPVAFWLVSKFVVPSVVLFHDYVESIFSGFPLILIYGIVITVLGLACFAFFFLGFCLWLLAAREIGLFLWGKVSIKRRLY